jgi:hypothetical protein
MVSGHDGARILLTVTLASCWAAVGMESGAAPHGLAQPSPPVSDPEREDFLLEGEVVRDQPAPGGITHPRQVTLRRGEYEHDALVQTYHEVEGLKRLEHGLEVDFRDSWRNNVAAYRVDRLLGLGFVPVTVARPFRGEPGAWTWWIDDVLMDERERYEKDISPPRPLEWILQNYVVKVFDQLIYNFDRSLENLLIDEHWRLWMIDHTRSFKVFGELKDGEELPPRCEKHLLAALRRLDRSLLEKTMEDLLEDKQVDGLLARRDRIVRFYDNQIAARGESAVLYELPPGVARTTGSGPWADPR